MKVSSSPMTYMNPNTCSQSLSPGELQGSGLIRTVGSCAQRRVALMPQVIATARDALSNDWCESAMRFKRPAKQALALATEPRTKREMRSVLCHTCK